MFKPLLLAWIDNEQILKFFTKHFEQSFIKTPSYITLLENGINLKITYTNSLHTRAFTSRYYLIPGLILILFSNFIAINLYDLKLIWISLRVFSFMRRCHVPFQARFSCITINTNITFKCSLFINMIRCHVPFQARF